MQVISAFDPDVQEEHLIYLTLDRLDSLMRNQPRVRAMILRWSLTRLEDCL